jgi:hypothetical protein
VAAITEDPTLIARTWKPWFPGNVRTVPTGNASSASSRDATRRTKKQPRLLAKSPPHAWQLISKNVKKISFELYWFVQINIMNFVLTKNCFMENKNIGYFILQFKRCC